MATGLMTNFFDNLRRLTDPGADSSTDGEPLSAYVDQQDE